MRVRTTTAVHRPRAAFVALGLTLLLAAWIMATPPFAAPDEGSHYLRALTITNGSIVSASGRFTGTVDAGGHVVMHTKENNRLDGQVDGSGHLTATAVSTKGCAYTFNWQKR